MVGWRKAAYPVAPWLGIQTVGVLLLSEVVKEFTEIQYWIEEHRTKNKNTHVSPGSCFTTEGKDNTETTGKFGMRKPVEQKSNPNLADTKAAQQTGT